MGPFCIFVPKMGGHRKGIDKTKYMSFFINDEKLLEKYNAIIEIYCCLKYNRKVRNIIKKQFDIKPVYNEKNLKR